MPPELPSRRPKPGKVEVEVEVEVIKAPGLAAFLRRHPKLGPRTAIGAIGSGVVLFLVAAATTPIAAAQVAAPPPVTASTSSIPAQAVVPALAMTSAAPAVQKALTKAPTHVKKQAPVTHGVISGLAANGIPKVALNAYRVAAARMANVQPGCGIDWALLAGIGRVESDHGRFAGAVLHADGVSTPRIIGIALDGSRSAAIMDTDGGRYDGDPVYDHAVGPMQFIPSTWRIYGTDATGDGTADVFNINDAALTAARYLCAAGGNLRSHDGQVRAVLAYNHSNEYLTEVLALADAYRRGVPISGIPVGITSGRLPGITDTGYVPPANPGAPPAAKPGSSTGKAPKPVSSPAGGRSTSGPSSTTAKASSTPTGTKSAQSSPTPTPTKSTSTTSKSGPTSSSTPTPTPSPTTTCPVLDHLLGKC